MNCVRESPLTSRAPSNTWTKSKVNSTSFMQYYHNGICYNVWHYAVRQQKKNKKKKGKIDENQLFIREYNVKGLSVSGIFDVRLTTIEIKRSMQSYCSVIKNPFILTWFPLGRTQTTRLRIFIKIFLWPRTLKHLVWWFDDLWLFV